MIVEEFLENGLVRHYSDESKSLLQNETGIVYGEAVDVVPCRYTYSEFENESAKTKHENHLLHSFEGLDL